MSVRLKLLSVAVILMLAPGHSLAQNPTLRTAMRYKLANAQPLFEAVVTADYPAIARSASALGRITETEIASWQVGAQTEYREQAMSFLIAVQGLRDAAATRDIHAALREYAALVSSCTRCHAHVRLPRMISETPALR